MPSIPQYRYYRGIMLPQIASLLGVRKRNVPKATRELHQAFKDYAGIDTLTKCDKSRTERYFSMIRMLISREKGLFVYEPKEPKGIEWWSMEAFLHYKLYEDGR